MSTEEGYKITITQSPPQVIEPMVDILSRDIFTRTNRKMFISRRRTYSLDRKAIEKAIQDNFPF